MRISFIAGKRVTDWCYDHQWGRDACIDALLPLKELGTVFELEHALIRLFLLRLT